MSSQSLVELSHNGGQMYDMAQGRTNRVVLLALIIGGAIFALSQTRLTGGAARPAVPAGKMVAITLRNGARLLR